MPDWTSWAISAVAGAGTGFVTALLTTFGAINRFEGSVEATLKAHDQRLTTLENDIRYEIRTIRDNMHALRNEFMILFNRRKDDV